MSTEDRHAIVTGFGFIEPPSDAPDVVAFGEWTCETCGVRLAACSSGCVTPTMRMKCHCGTVVEVIPS